MSRRFDGPNVSKHTSLPPRSVSEESLRRDGPDANTQEAIMSNHLPDIVESQEAERLATGLFASSETAVDNQSTAVSLTSVVLNGD